MRLLKIEHSAGRSNQAAQSPGLVSGHANRHCTGTPPIRSGYHSYYTRILLSLVRFSTLLNIVQNNFIVFFCSFVSILQY